MKRVTLTREQITSVSKSADGKHLQISFLQGKKQRSVTRHLNRNGKSWQGMNPDDRAKRLHQSAEERVKLAAKFLTRVEKALEELQTEDGEKKGGVLEIDFERATERVGQAKNTLELALKDEQVIKERFPIFVEYLLPA